MVRSITLGGTLAPLMIKVPPAWIAVTPRPNIDVLYAPVGAQVNVAPLGMVSVAGPPMLPVFSAMLTGAVTGPERVTWPGSIMYWPEPARLGPAYRLLTSPWNVSVAPLATLTVFATAPEDKVTWLP